MSGARDNAVAMFDYLEGYAAIESEILDAIRDVLRSGSLILGPRVRAFEEKFARFLGHDGRDQGGNAVGVGNGTDALAIALRALSVGPGDEVITVANTAIPTVSAIRMIGAVPVFCDIDPETGLIDPSGIEAHITARTKAIVPVHLYGNAVPMEPLLEIAAQRELKIVEDCAQSCGTTYRGRATGTFGDVSCFSFYPTKNLGAYGDGGLCYARDLALAESMRRIRFYGCGKTYYAEGEGVNSRLDELQAAILDVKLRHLPEYLRQRRRIARKYDECLAGKFRRVPPAAEVEHSYHLYVIQVANRPQVTEALQRENIGFGIHYPTPIHCMSGYEFLGYRRGDLPRSEQWADQVLSLPCYPELTDAVVERVAEVVNRVAS